MDLAKHMLVVAMASRLFHIYDIRRMDRPEQTRDSSLKYMTRALACMTDGQGELPFYRGQCPLRTKILNVFPCRGGSHRLCDSLC